MIPTTIVEKDQAGLEKIISVLQELVEERFIEGIKSKRYSTYEIVQMTEILIMHQHRLNLESNAVVRFSETFIRSFATPNNKCFETAKILFGKINSTISLLKNVFKKHTPRDYTQLPKGVEPPSVFDKSPLGKATYTPDMFGLESYPPEVKELYHTIETIFTTASSTLALCHLMIEQEEETRKDVKQLRQIYKESCNDLLCSVRAVIKFVSDKNELSENDLEKIRKKSNSQDKFLMDGYHKFDKKVLTQFVFLKAIREGQNQGLTDQEAFFWNQNHEKAFKVRTVIEKLNLVEGIEGQKGKLDSEAMVEFLKWCEVKDSLQKNLYVNYIRPQIIAKHHFKVLGWTTISGKRKELKEEFNISDEDLVRAFEKRLDPIFPNEEKKVLDTA